MFDVLCLFQGNESVKFEGGEVRISVGDDKIIKVPKENVKVIEINERKISF